ncbi:MAG: hypothetical protein GF347_01735 [Candidatus Moranbacteria bacterium]|nr:hypothetical protein [Candidatus Moranbacteria bacterium]
MPLLPRKIIGIFGVLGLTAALFLLFFESISTALFFLCGVILTLIYLEKPAWGFFLLIFIRQITDRYSDLTVFSLKNLFFINLSGALGLILIGFSAFFLIQNRSKVSKIPLAKPIALFMLLSLISFSYSVDLTLSLAEFLRVSGFFMLYLATYDLFNTNQEKKENLLKLIVIASVIPFMVGIFQIITKTGLGGTTGITSRIYSTYSHPNAFAIFALIIFAIAMYYQFVYQNKAPITKLPLIVYTGLTFALLILTYGRGGILALMCFSLILSFYRGNKIFIFLIGFVFAILFFVSPTVHNRIEDVYNPPANSSVRWRFEQWKRSWEIFLEKKVLGYGTGTEKIAFGHEYGYNLVYQAHNDYLLMLVELGIIGLILYLFLLSKILKKLYLAYQQAQNQNEKDLAFVILALSISLFFYAIVNNIHNSTAIHWIYWPLLALVLKKSKAQQE